MFQKTVAYRLAVLLVIVSASFATAAESLELGISAFRGSECDSSRDAIVGGSDCLIWLTYRLHPNRLDSSVYGHDFGNIPGDLKFLITSTALDCSATDLAAEELSIQSAQTFSQRIAEKFWHGDYHAIPKELWRRDQCFSVHVPEGLACRTLHVSAILNRAGQELMSNSDSIRVVPACGINDSLLVLRTRLYVLWVTQRTHYMSHQKEKKELRDFQTAHRKNISNESAAPAWACLDRQVNQEVSYDWNVRMSVDVLFGLPEPEPNPLRDYRGLLIEERARRLGNRDFLKRKFGRLLYSLAALPVGTYEINDLSTHRESRALVGSMAILHVSWIAEQDLECKPFQELFRPKYEGLGDLGPDRSWPKGLTIEAGVVPDSGKEFRPSVAMFRMMNPALCLDEGALATDSVYHASPESLRWTPEAKREFRIALSLPDALAGKRIAFRAEYDHEHYGHFETDYPPDGFMVPNYLNIERARTRDDTVAMLHLRISGLTDMRRYAEAVSLADSAMDTGYFSERSYLDASRAAFCIQNWDESLKLIDAQYRGAGWAEPRFGCGNEEPTPRDPIDENRNYLRRRTQVLWRKAHGLEGEFDGSYIQLEILGWRVSDCDSTPNNLISGAPAQLELHVRFPQADSADYAFRGLRDGWPIGLKLEIQETNPEGNETPGNLWPGAFPEFQVCQTPDEELRAGKWQKKASSYGSNYAFHFVPTDSLADRTFTLHAEYAGPSGETAVSRDDLKFRVVAPCSELDRANVAAMPAYFDWVERDYAAALQRIDSLTAAGRISPFTLFVGWRAARYDGSLERALHYLDLAFDTYGYVGVIPAAKQNLHEDNRTAYLRYRQALQGGSATRR